MNKLSSVAIFCGSSMGSEPEFAIRARELGLYLAQQNIRLIYGGAQVGLMGEVADSCLKAGGEVVGVIPSFLSTKEIAHTTLSELILTKTMHERKACMVELAEAFVALPGGFGTMDELFEILTWAQLGLHTKPIGLLNIKNYFDPLLKMLETMTNFRFLNEDHKNMLLHSDNIEVLLSYLQNYQAPDLPKWIKNMEEV